MGWTKLKTKAVVAQVVGRIEEGGGFIREENNFYHYFNKNSHHFTDALPSELCGMHITRWLWRGAYAGEILTGLERQMRTEDERVEQERRNGLSRSGAPRSKAEQERRARQLGTLISEERKAEQEAL